MAEKTYVRKYLGHAMAPAEWNVFVDILRLVWGTTLDFPGSPRFSADTRAPHGLVGSWTDANGDSYEVSHVEELQNAYEEGTITDLIVRALIGSADNCTVQYHAFPHNEISLHLGTPDISKAESIMEVVKRLFPLEGFNMASRTSQTRRQPNPMDSTAKIQATNDVETVFISYSHKDETWKDRVAKHLGVAQQEGMLDVWDDRRIGGGADWELAIDDAMARARAALLLVSADFLTSRFVRSKEVPKLLTRRTTEGLPIFSVILKPCDWKAVEWLRRMNLRPMSGNALSGMTSHNRDAALTALAEEVRTRLSHP